MQGDVGYVTCFEEKSFIIKWIWLMNRYIHQMGPTNRYIHQMGPALRESKGFGKILDAIGSGENGALQEIIFRRRSGVIPCQEYKSGYHQQEQEKIYMEDFLYDFETIALLTGPLRLISVKTDHESRYNSRLEINFYLTMCDGNRVSYFVTFSQSQYRNPYRKLIARFDTAIHDVLFITGAAGDVADQPHQENTNLSLSNRITYCMHDIQKNKNTWDEEKIICPAGPMGNIPSFKVHKS